jgi:arsenate reductase
MNPAEEMNRMNRREMLTMTLLAACLPAFAADQSGPKRILIICTGNSARSQMTEGFLRSLDPNLSLFSAGTAPAPQINPYAVRAMQEIGIDISHQTPKNVRQFLGQPFDFVVTVCDDADKNCPNFSGKVGRRLHIGFPDPAKATGTDAEKMAVFRKVRDDIRMKFKEFYRIEIRKAG